MSERTEPNQVGTSQERRDDDDPHGPLGGVAAGAAGVCSEAAAAHLDCGTALHDLYGYLDGEIDDERCEQIRRHIEDCSPCLEAYDFEAELRQLVARTCQCEAPESLRARVARALEDCENGGGDAPGT